MNSRDPHSRDERIEQAIRGVFAVLFACVPIIMAAGVLVYFLVLRQ
ncbi:MAG: hypothetical protein KF777_01570 [Planctomycetaceae bacterium]|nr:hypothetical protein [Planctomycetaceae bacterium]